MWEGGLLVDLVRVGVRLVWEIIMEEVFQNGNYQREANANMTAMETRKEVKSPAASSFDKSIWLVLTHRGSFLEIIPRSRNNAKSTKSCASCAISEVSENRNSRERVRWIEKAMYRLTVLN